MTEDGATAPTAGAATASRGLGARGLLLAVAAICIAAIGFLALEVAEDLRFLETADSDNVHWTLSQAEVEFLDFQNAVKSARLGDPPYLDRVILEFDIFYSRMNTLANGKMFERLHDDPGFAAPVARVRATLDALIPLIDGPQAQLRAALPDLAVRLEALRPTVRAFATAGLSHFARDADQRRRAVAVTLLRLAAVTGALLMALAVLAFHSRRVMLTTERRGQELANANARMNTILATALDGVIVAGMDGRIVDFNPAAERIFLRSREEAVGRRIGDVIVPGHLRAAHEAGMKRMRDHGEMRIVGQGRVQVEALRGDGSVFPAELAIERAVTDEGVLAVAFLRDISHRVAAERELVEARDRALAGEKAKADFLAMMTHEIRTPLNGVLGNLSLLRDTALDDDQARYVRNMGISGDLLMQHVDAVLDVARFEAGATVARIETVHIGRLVQDIVDSQSIAAEANGNSLSCSWVGPPLDWIRIDGQRLQQILINLVGNAIKFTQAGDIRIELEAAPRNDASDIALEIRVSDTGIGISEADQTRIFEDFRVLSHTDARTGSGTGLGLGIVRRFVEAMQGEIEVESEPGAGSVFALRLPVTRADAPETAVPDGTPAAPQAGPYDVLLVEDNPVNMAIGRELLDRLGHRVSTAGDGAEALAMAQDRRFDLILMDIRMPVMDGLTATRKIREGTGPNRDVPIVAFSANVLPDAKERFAAAGMSGFLGKPLRRRELTELIGQTVTRPGHAADIAPAAAQAADIGPGTGNGAAPAGADDPMAALLDRHMAETRALFDWLAGGPSDRSEIAERAHRCAGSAAAFGQPDLQIALVALEAAAEADDGPDLAPAIARARAAWNAAPRARLH